MSGFKQVSKIIWGHAWWGLVSGAVNFTLDVWFFSNKTFDKVSVLTSFAQSWSVLVLTFMKSLSLDKSWSWHLWNFPVLMSLSLNIYKNFQSQWVLVSTSVKFPSLDESRSRHLQNCSVSMSLGLDKFSDVSLEPKGLLHLVTFGDETVVRRLIPWGHSTAGAKNFWA